MYVYQNKTCLPRTIREKEVTWMASVAVNVRNEALGSTEYCLPVPMHVRQH